MTGPAAANCLDVALALRRIVLVFWHDFAPIVVLGFGMVTLPALAQTLVGSHSGSTIVATFGGMLRVLYVVIVTVGVLARLTGTPLAPDAFVRNGIAASPRGLSVALLLGAGTVLVFVLLLLAKFAAGFADAVRLAIVISAFMAGTLVVPALPAALLERLMPLAALRRAARLTYGNRGSIGALLLIVGLAIVPVRIILAASVYGSGASLAQAAAIDAAMTLASPGLWLLALFDLLAWGLGAMVPAVVYVGLVERA